MFFTFGTCSLHVIFSFCLLSCKHNRPSKAESSTLWRLQWDCKSTKSCSFIKLFWLAYVTQAFIPRHFALKNSSCKKNEKNTFNLGKIYRPRTNVVVVLAANRKLKFQEDGDAGLHKMTQRRCQMCCFVALPLLPFISYLSNLLLFFLFFFF